MKGHLRHVALYKILRLLLYPLGWVLFRLESGKAPDIEGPYLVFSNHNINLDPLLITRSFPKHMYFMTSEHVLSMGMRSTLLDWVAGPVSKMKSNIDTKAVKDVIKRIRKGYNICIFAEGNRSFNGRTYPIVASTAKLVRTCGATVVTYRFEGGYLSSPRWSRTIRKGKMTGTVVGVYSPDNLKEKSDKEIENLIQNDIFEDAYVRQAKEQVRYQGKNLAEWIEMAVYICPLCGRIGTIKSSGDHFFCDACDFFGTVDDMGYLSGESVPYRTILEWDNWQRDQIRMLSETIGSAQAFTDPGQTLFLVDPISHKRQKLNTETLIMYGDRLALGDDTFWFRDIVDMSIYGQQTIAFSSYGAHYEIKSKFPRSGRKYVLLFKYMTGKTDTERV